MATIRSDRRYVVPVDRAGLWCSLDHVERFPRWWPWLREFDGSNFAGGSRWHCAVRVPFLYTLRFEVLLDRVDPGHRVEATVSGDIAGHAVLQLSDADGGSAVQLRSSLTPRRRLLRAVSSVAPPLARRGHEWVLSRGADQFFAQSTAPTPTPTPERGPTPGGRRTGSVTSGE